MLRRNILAFTVLGAALGVVPTVGAEQAVGWLLLDNAAGDAQGAFLLMRGIIATAVVALSDLSVTALDVAVMAMALGPGQAGRGVPRLVVRLLPAKPLCFVSISVLVGAAPEVIRTFEGASIDPDIASAFD